MNFLYLLVLLVFFPSIKMSLFYVVVYSVKIPDCCWFKGGNFCYLFLIHISPYMFSYYR